MWLDSDSKKLLLPKMSSNNHVVNLHTPTTDITNPSPSSCPLASELFSTQHSRWFPTNQLALIHEQNVLAILELNKKEVAQPTRLPTYNRILNALIREDDNPVSFPWHFGTSFPFLLTTPHLYRNGTREQCKY
uniref:Uncharacterized protein n=1 Tax=Molossus molossus TaxID=27622 RepID=A0A7J8DC74_MOLMO|nr:hypothetical protein HJG59_009334 [Molossus molossus]